MKTSLRSLLATLIGLVLGASVAWFAGESPLRVLHVLYASAFSSWYAFGMTLFYGVPLVFTGLSVAIAYRAGMFNIGAEGQLTMGALAVALTASHFSGLPVALHLLLVLVAGFAGGAFWAFIPGWIKARRGGHEVIATIMLNYVAAGVANWFVIDLFPNPETQSPEMQHAFAHLIFPFFELFDDAQVSWLSFLPLIVAGLVYLWLAHTSQGFEVTTLGENENACRSLGLNTARLKIWAMAVAGGVAGLVGVVEILGNAGTLRLGFSPGFGFAGIAVAFLGRCHPLGVIPAALLFGALHKGTGDLEFETEMITKDLAAIIQAFIIITVAADRLWQHRGFWPRKPVQRNGDSL